MRTTTPLDRGRVNQKRRTRDAILGAAGRLIERGEAPTLSSVAEEAMVSRAPAYRYFASPEALIREAGLASKVATALT